jgi:hypothetical protein
MKTATATCFIRIRNFLLFLREKGSLKSVSGGLLYDHLAEKQNICDVTHFHCRQLFEFGEWKKQKGKIKIQMA